MPVPGIAGRPARNYQTEQSAKLSIADTGTSFIAGQTLSSADDKWLRKIGAEQKLFDGVSITGSIGETPQGTTEQEPHRGIQAQLVAAEIAVVRRHIALKIEHCRILAPMRSKSAALMALLHFRRAGDIALATRETGE